MTDPAAPAAERAADQDTPDLEQVEPVVVQQITNNFHHMVSGKLLNLGFADEEPPRRRTGPLLDSEVDAALTGYVRPAPFDQARERLRDRGLVILRGPHGLGKRAGALALLDASGAKRPLVGLSPTLSLSDLLRHGFRGGQGYVVQDRAQGHDASDAAEYEFAELGRVVKRAEACLVITATDTIPGAPRDLMIDWAAPPPLEVLDALLGAEGASGVDADTAARIREHFVGCQSPSKIARFAASLAEAGDPAAAIGLLEDSDAAAISTWFDTEPEAATLLLVTGLAFLHGVPERQFERSLSLLESKVRSTHAPPDEEDEKEPVLPRPRGIARTRRLRVREVDLIELASDTDSPTGAARERNLVFASSGHRQHVLTELWTQYGVSLWDPVRDWINEVVATTDSIDEVLSIALGLALLAHEAPSAVREDYLDRWASGSPREREAACYTLWFACLSDELASEAFSITVRWAASRSESARATAIACLSGELGQRFPGDALRWLWHLMSIPAHHSAARNGMLALFRGTVARDEPDTSILAFLHTQLRRAKRDRSQQRHRLTLTVLGDLLGARNSTGEPAIATLMLKRPQACETLGPLWAEALVHRPHRGMAIRRLSEALLGLDDTKASQKVAEPLGAAIVGVLDATEMRLLRRDLFHEFARRNGSKSGDARLIVDVLLASAQPSEDQPPEEGGNQ